MKCTDQNILNVKCSQRNWINFQKWKIEIPFCKSVKFVFSFVIDLHVCLVSFHIFRLSSNGYQDGYIQIQLIGAEEITILNIAHIHFTSFKCLNQQTACAVKNVVCITEVYLFFYSQWWCCWWCSFLPGLIIYFFASSLVCTLQYTLHERFKSNHAKKGNGRECWERFVVFIMLFIVKQQQISAS